MPGRHRARPGRRSGRWAWTCSYVCRCTASTLAALLLWTILPALLGWHSSVVMSGSMMPALRPGDIAVVRPVELADVQMGQVLLVDDPDHPGRLRLHRLVGTRDGQLLLKGDANRNDDSTPVEPAQVHGIATLRVPFLGLPGYWFAEREWLRLGAAALGLGLVLAGSRLYRRPVGRTPVDALLLRLGVEQLGRSAWQSRVQVVAVGAAMAYAVTVALPAHAASYAATASNSGDSFSAAAYYTCQNAAFDGSSSSPGTARAIRYYALQESSGTTAADTGSQPVSGTYLNTPTYSTSGPANCGTNGTRAITLNGSTQWVNTATSIGTGVTAMTEEIWFKTTDTNGGRLIGFGDQSMTNKTATTPDRQLYITSGGLIAFGVMAGTTKNAVLSTSAYNNGAWHLATGVLSSSAMTLYIDGVSVATSTATTSATAAQASGYLRIGFDSLSGWPSAPTNYYFAGSVAHAAVYGTALTSTQVAAHYRAGLAP